MPKPFSTNRVKLSFGSRYGVSFVSRATSKARGILFSAVWSFATFTGAAVGQSSQPQTPAAPPAATSQTPAPANQPQAAPPSQTQNPGTAENQDPAWTFGLFYWLTVANPDLKGGAAAPDFETLDSIGKSKPAPEAELAIRVSSNDVIRVSVFQMQGRANSTTPVALDLFSTQLAANDFLRSQYTLSSGKASFEDLLYPFPGKGAKLRFKTLWEVQATRTNMRIDAPFDTSLQTSSNTTIFPSATGNRWVILPAFGLSMQYAASEHLHLELRGSGFGIPHHADTADAEGTIAYRIGHVEVVVGGRLYEWKTSPKNTEYVQGMITGGFAGLRWVGK